MERKDQSRYGLELFRLLTETLQEYAIYAMDPQGNVVHWNTGATRVTGYSGHEVLGRPLHRIFTPEDRAARVPETELRTAETIGRAEDDRWHVRKDGTRFWGVGLVVPIRGEDGELLGFGKIVRDRTDLKELQEALQNRVDALTAADERKNVFLAMLVHELRNPQDTLSNVAVLLRRSASGEPVQEIAGMIDRQVRRMKMLTDDLVDIVRVSRGKLKLERRRMDVRSIVANALETVRPAAEERQLELRVAQMAVPVEVNVDPDRMLQVLVNLLTNAIRYTDPGGQIGVTSGTEGNEAVLRVHDTGIGLQQEHLESIFDLFSQAHLALPESQLGLGIGLSLVKNLVQLHGGTVQALSDGLGKGSEFIVRLPLVGRG